MDNLESTLEAHPFLTGLSPAVSATWWPSAPPW